MNQSGTDPVTVVVVDDSPGIRRALRLAIDGHADLQVVAVGADGIEGIEVSREHRPDVVLIDFKMPRMDGIHAARQIIAELPDTRIVMLSAYDDMSIIDDATAAGVDDFLCKGVPARVIHASLLRAGRMESRSEALAART